MKIVIIGNGIAGTNAARYIRKKSDHEIVMISEETLQPYSRTALMYVYMGHVKQSNTHLYEDWFWDKNRIKRIKSRVKTVNIAEKSLFLDNNETINYDKLIIATGSKPNKFGWPGQDLIGVQGLYHLQDLETMEQYSPGLQRAVIVGGGLIGIEMAEMFHSRHIPVTFLVREKSFWNPVLPPEESAMINRHILEHGIDLRLETELKEIISDDNGRAKAIITNKGEEIACGFVGLTVGVSPNIEFLGDTADGGRRTEDGQFIQCNRGILVNEYLQTSDPDVFAIGDCAELRTPSAGRRPIEAIWYTGRMMGQTVAKTICGEKTAYQPRLWFNSAKFLDIEYQVYGDISAQKPDHITSLYWEHPQGKKSIRLNFDTNTREIKGFNLMGIRYRHEVCEKWILEKTPIEVVLKNLKLANFDPEFFQRYESSFLEKYKSLHWNKT
jgi:NAD(P)H-nitrite reductase large subunit